MREIKKGDIVSRISYKNDIMFEVKRILKLVNEKKIAILKGIDVRVEADAPVEDLQIISKEEQIKREKELENRIKIKARSVEIKVEVAVVRVKITLACTECKQRNYNMTKDKKTHPDRMETKKYCKFCKAHTLHKETK